MKFYLLHEKYVPEKRKERAFADKSTLMAAAKKHPKGLRGVHDSLKALLATKLDYETQERLKKMISWLSNKITRTAEMRTYTIPQFRGGAAFSDPERARPRATNF